MWGSCLSKVRHYAAYSDALSSSEDLPELPEAWNDGLMISEFWPLVLGLCDDPEGWLALASPGFWPGPSAPLFRTFLRSYGYLAYQWLPRLTLGQRMRKVTLTGVQWTILSLQHNATTMVLCMWTRCPSPVSKKDPMAQPLARILLFQTFKNGHCSNQSQDS
jgi:hypothetical protein